MAKKDNKQKRKGPGISSHLQSLRAQIHPETEKSILGIIFVCIAAILILARFHNAGPAGESIYTVLSKLFGWGYYLFPAIFLVMAGTFFFNQEQREKRALTLTFVGAAFFVMAGLGIIDMIYPDKGGYIGRWMGALEIPFGHTTGLVVAFAILTISLLITVNVPFSLLRKRDDKEEDAGENEEEIEPVVIDALSEPKAAKAKAKKPEAEKEEEPEKAAKELEEEDLKIQEKAFTPALSKKKSLGEAKNYVFPPLNLLHSSVEKPTSGDLRANANIIKRTLESFGIPVEMGEISIGPKVTRYTLKPAEGIKLSRIIALNQDMALALAAHPIRIEAPIPGKSLVGIEVPNKSAAVVRLGSLMSYPEFATNGPLSFILGRDVTGEPIFADIGKMPHLLVAGATGSGKSVAIHSIVVSMLYKNSPETLRMVMIDPKRVELTLYNDIPHLISPVITEGKKALGVFRWAIAEMESRYQKLQSVGARDIKSYNKYKPEEQLPYILIVVDELADLMATYGRDIEGSIVRLAQMARATGIHLVLSTQRPSVEVITGLIKANIPARMALQVASQVDSRTILDMAGAEKLLGGGDMLFTSSDMSKPKRIQGAFITEEELHSVADFIRDNNKPTSSSASLDATPVQGGTVAMPGLDNPIGLAAGSSETPNFDSFAKDEDSDELYEEAVRVVREAQKASASLLQRRLAVGYARAARLIDLMEEKGVVGPGEGAKPREVYLDKEDPMVDGSA